jgi:hypothetical protein
MGNLFLCIKLFIAVLILIVMYCTLIVPALLEMFVLNTRRGKLMKFMHNTVDRIFDNWVKI